MTTEGKIVIFEALNKKIIFKFGPREKSLATPELVPSLAKSTASSLTWLKGHLRIPFTHAFS